MNADTLLKVALGILTLLGTVVTATGYVCREFIKYLFRRIDVLEGRESTLLVGMVAGVKQQGEELAAQGALIRELARQDERREWLREQGGKR